MKRTVTITIGETDLEVTGYYQPREWQTRDYPGCPEEFTPDEIMLGKIDITDLIFELAPEWKIEELVFEQMKKDAEL